MGIHAGYNGDSPAENKRCNLQTREASSFLEPLATDFLDNLLGPRGPIFSLKWHFEMSKRPTPEIKRARLLSEIPLASKWALAALMLLNGVCAVKAQADKLISGEAREIYIRETIAACRVLNARVTPNFVALDTYCDCMARAAADVITIRMTQTEISGTEEEKQRNWQRVLQPAAERAHPGCNAKAWNQ